MRERKAIGGNSLLKSFKAAFLNSCCSLMPNISGAVRVNSGHFAAGGLSCSVGLTRCSASSRLLQHVMPCAWAKEEMCAWLMTVADLKRSGLKLLGTFSECEKLPC